MTQHTAWGVRWFYCASGADKHKQEKKNDAAGEDALLDNDTDREKSAS
jgi:hypothetical protein